MRLKLDENLSRHLKASLQHLGHEVETAGEEGLLSRPDGDVAAAAASEGRMLLTLDLDFSDARKYPPGSHPGIVLFRPGSMGPLTVNAFVEATNLEDLAGCLVVVDPDRVRVRRSPLSARTPGSGRREQPAAL